MCLNQSAYTLHAEMPINQSACRSVNGLDATAARTFGTLAAALQHKGVTLIIAHVPKQQMRKLLTAHGVTDKQAPSAGELASHDVSHGTLGFATLDAGVHVRP